MKNLRRAKMRNQLPIFQRLRFQRATYDCDFSSIWKRGLVFPDIAELLGMPSSPLLKNKKMGEGGEGK